MFSVPVSYLSSGFPEERSHGTVGTFVVIRVDEIPSTSDLSEPLCFYLVRLERAHIKDPVWFHHEEVEPIAPST